MKPDSLPRTALTWAPEFNGREREVVREKLGEGGSKERCEMGFKTWTEAARIAIDRKRWKNTIESPRLQVE